MKEVICVIATAAAAMVIASVAQTAKSVELEMQERIRESNYEAEERGEEVRMSRERAVQSSGR